MLIQCDLGQGFPHPHFDDRQVVKGVILLLAVLYDEIRRNRAEEA